MPRFPFIRIALILAPLLAGCAGPGGETASVAPLETRETAIGVVLTDREGYTLYTYKNDPAGASECAGRCARKWPPVKAVQPPPDGGGLSVIERKDGVRQYAYRGKALYRWVKDKAPGDVKGHNLGEVWFAARP